MSNDISRRAFLKRLTQMGIAGAASPLGMNLVSSANAANLEQDDSYKAIVYYYLAGGCDQMNTLVPYDTPSYDSYATIRPSIALPYDDILPIDMTTGLSAGRQMALHPNLIDFQRLFHEDKIAVVQNIGPLVVPTTLQQYIDKSVQLPPELFSHAGQSAYWQTLSSDKSAVGWGGRIGDLLAENNGEHIVFTNVSTSLGSVDITNGDIANKYTINSDGPEPFELSTRTHNRFNTREAREKILEMVTETRHHLLEDEITALAKRSIDAEASYREAIEAVKPVLTEFSNESSSSKLKVIAEMISANAARGVRRQVFFVPVSGFDSHANLLESHGDMMSIINSDIADFQAAMEEIDQSDNVTMLVTSEFGRTLTSNGDGSDHGWGTNAFLIGNAVNAGFYGETPEIKLDTEIDVGGGRWLPTTPIEAMSVSLARWFGVSESDLPEVCPNFKNFYDADFDLGILS